MISFSFSILSIIFFVVFVITIPSIFEMFFSGRRRYFKILKTLFRINKRTKYIYRLKSQNDLYLLVHMDLKSDKFLITVVKGHFYDGVYFNTYDVISYIIDKSDFIRSDSVSVNNMGCIYYLILIKIFNKKVNKLKEKSIDIDNYNDIFNNLISIKRQFIIESLLNK